MASEVKANAKVRRSEKTDTLVVLVFALIIHEA